MAGQGREQEENIKNKQRELSGRVIGKLRDMAEEACFLFMTIENPRNVFSVVCVNRGSISGIKNF
ncbi:hypothetical protein V1224_14510 [Lachnospiraceae bacterium JLR.KK008]